MSPLLLLLLAASSARAEWTPAFLEAEATVRARSQAGDRAGALAAAKAMPVSARASGADRADMLLKRAEYEASLGDLAAAEADDRAALEAKPGDFLALCVLTQFLRDRGRYAESLAFADRLTTVTEGIAAVNAAEKWLQRAETLMRLGRVDEAAADVERALREKPEDHPSLWLMVQVKLKAGLPAQALPYADRMIRASKPGPETARAYAQRAQVRWALGDRTGAQQDEERALAADPSDDHALESRMQHLREEGRLDEAAALADRMVAASAKEAAPRRALMRVQRAQVRMRRRDWSGADEDIRAAFAIEPDSAEALRARVELLLDGEPPDLEGALRSAELLVRVSSQATAGVRSEALLLRARALLAGGRRQEAAAARAEVRALAPDSPGALADSARAALDAGDAAKAESLAERLIAATEDGAPMARAEALMIRGSALLALKRRSEAQAEFEKASRLAPDQSYPIEMIVKLELEDDRLDDVERRAQQLYALAPSTAAPKRAAALALRARVRAALGRAPEALADISDALELDPAAAQALASTLETLSRREGGADLLPFADRAVAAAPTARAPRRLRAHLLNALGRREEAAADADVLVALSTGGPPGEAAEALLLRAGLRAATGDARGAEEDHRAAEGSQPGIHALSAEAGSAWAAALFRVRGAADACALLSRLRAATAAPPSARAAFAAIEAAAAWGRGQDDAARALMSQATGLDAEAACGASLLEDRAKVPRAWFDACLAARPRDAAVLTDRGVSSWLAGRRDEAVADFRAALKASPGSLSAALSLASALEAGGDASQAARVLGDALTAAAPADPLAAEARRTLARLRAR